MPQKIGVVGGGMIGASLAAMFAGNGIHVVLITRPGSEARAEANITSIYDDLVRQSLLTRDQAKIALRYVTCTADYESLGNVEFIWECVPERTSVKHAVYSQIQRYCHSVRAVASATSAISADELAEGFTDPALRRSLVVAHPWNPPHLVPCVELVKSCYVCHDAVSFTEALLRMVGKQVVVLEKNIPGFIGNRLQYAMLREAIHIVEEGAATPEMVDQTLKYSFAPRYTSIGIFEHFDNCGQDLTMDICNYLFPDLCDAKSAQPSLVQNCEAGNLGVKTGQGMRNWHDRDISAFRSLAASPYYHFFNWKLPRE